MKKAKVTFARLAQSTQSKAVAFGAGCTALAQNVLAAVDISTVETSLDAAQSSGESVGTLVIGVVAGLVVVGLIIAMVKKL